ncbi:hypothetical protein PW5551_09605 [Petrotoga sp. 9PW.55.5.1]|uniref:hypothetical protein n=1 Tax=Petrotoga sp. 9PW.55.5.1 TaxID=1308979 RepID=UPI000DC4B10D|nr:hypothetical protein [Petrotoga sp. 9PW.55.5.1]RAO98462.1 hypothetical protein PW5551_09605 [Petrotoga sp. 9PW.55.5.1]
MKKTIFLTLILVMINMSVFVFSQANDSLNIPVYVSIPSYAVIESVDTNRLDYQLDLSTPENASQEVKVKIAANTPYELNLEFVADEDLNQTLANLLNSSYNYSVDSNESQTGVVEKTANIGFDFQKILNENPEIQESLLAYGTFNDKVGDFVFTVSAVL